MTEHEPLEVRLQVALDEARRAWLTGKLLRTPGIVHAVFDPDDPQHLHLEYQPQAFSPVTLLDFLAEHGAPAQAA